MGSKLDILNEMFIAIEKQKYLLKAVENAEKSADDSIEFLFGKLRVNVIIANLY